MKFPVALASLGALCSITVTPALADLGHLGEDGHGHAHWLALAIFGGLALWGGVKLLRRRAARRAQPAARR